MNEKVILIDSYINNNFLQIFIKDNAGGIPSNYINDIFDSGFTTKENSDGTGIGLSMSKSIVSEHMKGTINVRNTDFVYNNTKYTGAEFIITLPMTNKENLLVWNDKKMSVGIKKIDDQHKEFINIINRLSITINNNSQYRDVYEIIDDLIEYAHFHFSTEEELLKKFNYNDISSHEKEHQKFFKKFNILKKDILSNELKNDVTLIEIADDIFQFTTKWFLDHIINSDRKYILTLQNNQIK